jgi:hypothetical protein
LRFTDPISANTYVEAKDQDSSLVVLFDSEPLPYHCPKTDEGPGCRLQVTCHEKAGERQRANSLGQRMQNLAAAILPLFAESPTRYVTPVSRGIEPELADAVVLLQDNSIDFAPAFQEMDPATYRVRLEPLSSSTQPSGAVQIQWRGTGPALVPVPGVHTGLCRLVRLDPTSESAGTEAWVLISGPDRFSQDSNAFQVAVEATKKWPDDVDARAPRAVLRAYLDSLSRQAKQ